MFTNGTDRHGMPHNVQSISRLNGDDHTLTMTTAITMAMTMATTKQLHQDFSKIILCDFRVSFVSQINWQPIGKLLFMIQHRPYIWAGWWYNNNNTDKPMSVCWYKIFGCYPGSKILSKMRLFWWDSVEQWEQHLSRTAWGEIFSLCFFSLFCQLLFSVLYQRTSEELGRIDTYYALREDIRLGCTTILFWWMLCT